MRVAAALTVASCVAVALGADSTVVLTLLLVVGAFGNALAGPAVSVVLQREIARGRQGMGFGWQQSGASIGALVAGLALPAVAIPFGWRWAFVAAAAIAVAAVALAPADPERKLGASGADRPRDGARRGHGLGVVHALGLSAALAGAAGTGLVSFIVLYGVESGMSETAAGLLLGGLSLVATAGRVGLGALADRGGDGLAPVATMLALSVGGYLLLIAGEPVVVAVAALLAGALGWSWPGALTLAVVRRSPDAPAWAVGVMMSGLFVGAVGGPLLVGVLAEADRFEIAWALCAALSLAAAAVIAATRRRESAAPGA